MSELDRVDISARIAGAVARERSALEAWVEEALSRDPSDAVQQKLRVPLRLRQALDRASSITGKSKNALMVEFIVEGLRRLKTIEDSARAKAQKVKP